MNVSCRCTPPQCHTWCRSCSTYSTTSEAVSQNIPYNEVRAKLTEMFSGLTEMFSGLTAYTRAPAAGPWNTGSTVKRDDIIFVEVMTDELDRSS